MNKKLAVLLISIVIMLSSCSGGGINIEGNIKHGNFDGETINLYAITSSNYDVPVLVSTTTVKGSHFAFEKVDVNKNNIGEELPTVAFLSMYDMLDESVSLEETDNTPFATLILEEGKIKIEFDDASVLLSGTTKNNDFNKIHEAITNLVAFAQNITDFSDLDNIAVNEEGKDGRAQFQELNQKLRDLTFDFTKDNMTNNIGHFLFLKSYGDNMFSPLQMLELINSGSDKFKEIDEVKELSRILESMSEGGSFIKSNEDIGLSESNMQ